MSITQKVINIDKNLFGLLTCCQNCPFFKDIVKIKKSEVVVNCWLCGTVVKEFNHIASDKCKNSEIKKICQSFYSF